MRQVLSGRGVCPTDENEKTVAVWLSHPAVITLKVHLLVKTRAKSVWEVFFILQNRTVSTAAKKRKELLFALVFTAAMSAASALQSAASSIASAAASAASAAASASAAAAGAGKPAANYKGGIYNKGAFLTWFAENGKKSVFRERV